MSEKKERRPRRRRRGRRVRKKRSIVSGLIMLISVSVFCVSGYMLIKSLNKYKGGREEYKAVYDISVKQDKEGKSFYVDFTELNRVNMDVIGWLRFYPEPKEISYPLVQGADNAEYLTKTFSSNTHEFGTIFLDCDTSKDFSARNSILYGHNMKDGSMFAKLMEYREKEFWEKNPYFYIYTPEDMELTYRVYSAGIIPATDFSYVTLFETDEEFEAFLDHTKKVAAYDTGVEIKAEDKVVTLSTCTNVNDNERFVVRGVLERSAPVKKP